MLIVFAPAVLDTRQVHDMSELKKAAIETSRVGDIEMSGGVYNLLSEPEWAAGTLLAMPSPRCASPGT